MRTAIPTLAVIVLLGVLAPRLAAQETGQPQLLPADQMLDRMLQPAQGEQAIQPSDPRAGTDQTSGSGAVAPGAPQLTVLREGSYIVDRLGRLAPSPDGQQMEFVFESDGKTLQDPPLVILPNLKLMAMERAAEALRDRDVRFRVTGMLTEYKGRNYVLLHKVVVVPEGQ